MSFTVLIPARLASTRLPGKVLLPIGELPMIEQVRRRALASGALRVVVAADDMAIAAALEPFGAEVVLTAAEHRCGSERLAEAASILGLGDEEIVVNLQGDEPQMPPQLIAQVALLLSHSPDLGVTTAAVPIQSWEELQDPHSVKVVLDTRGRALYFSRAPIPWDREHFPLPPGSPLQPGVFWRHLGLYAYRVAFLRDYAAWPQAQLEQVESLEQLRILAQGLPMGVYCAQESPPAGVDTPADLARVRAAFSCSTVQES